MADEKIVTDRDVVGPSIGHRWRRISWPAIFGGTMISFGVGLLFGLFGLAIAFAMYDPGNPRGMSLWSMVWYFVTAFCALFAGGWAAARLAPAGEKGDGVMHGLVTWGLTTTATLVFGLGILLFLTNGVVSAAAVTASSVPNAMPKQPLPSMGQIQQNAAAVAEAVANWVRAFALTAFFGTLAAAVGAIIGGRIGQPHSFVIAVEPTPEL